MWFTQDFVKNIAGRQVLLDTNFLIRLSQNTELMDWFIDLQSVEGFFPLIDTHVRFEFLRDIFVPDIKKAKEAILENFIPAADENPIIYKNTYENSLSLSRVCKHKIKDFNGSFVDLFIGGNSIRINSLILTSNRKDFPSPIFDVVGLVAHEMNNLRSKTPKDPSLPF